MKVTNDYEFGQSFKLIKLHSLFSPKISYASRPEMYHENVCQAELAAEAIGGGVANRTNNFFAPAYDPFITAFVLKKIVAGIKKHGDFSNLYLCPLATKAQVLGFSLFYLMEMNDTPCSIIYPFCDELEKKTSEGISRIWKYTVELPGI